jgi:hypothetical protein
MLTACSSAVNEAHTETLEALSRFRRGFRVPGRGPDPDSEGDLRNVSVPDPACCGARTHTG